VAKRFITLVRVLFGQPHPRHDGTDCEFHKWIYPRIAQGAPKVLADSRSGPEEGAAITGDQGGVRPVTTVTNLTGTLNFTDTAEMPLAQRFYRAKSF
jgi:hypothetical protein